MAELERCRTAAPSQAGSANATEYAMAQRNHIAAVSSRTGSVNATEYAMAAAGRATAL